MIALLVLILVALLGGGWLVAACFALEGALEEPEDPRKPIIWDRYTG